MKYDIIYSDPPWKQTKGGLRKARPNQAKNLDYETMEIKDIKNIHVDITKYVKETHTVFMWTIDKFLHEAETMMADLGYKLHARIIWDKENGIAPAFTVRYAHEYLLWFYKPKMLKIAEDMRGKYTTVLREKATKHSKKPEVAYKLIEDLYPDANKLEMYARNKRDGWDAWGNEVNCDIKL